MNALYTSDNVKNTLKKLQKRYYVIHNKQYSIQQIIYAFNRLIGKYQDLILKPDKNENDKVKLNFVYDYFSRYLRETKDVPDDIKINIKNINNKTEEKKEDITLEDIEIDHGEKWVRPKEKKKTIKNDKREFIVIKKQKEEKIVRPVETVGKPIENKGKKLILPEEYNNKQEEPKEQIVIKQFIDPKKEEHNKPILEEYKKDRVLLDIDSLVDVLALDDDEKLVILFKYENNSVKTNEEVANEFCVKKSYVDDVVDKFLSMAIEYKSSNIYKLERKLELE